MRRNLSKISFFVFLLVGLIMAFSHYSYRQEQKRLEFVEQQKQEALQAAEKADKYKKLNLEQVRCMALNIYHEAGSEPFMGQVAVARVVMNRVRHGFASTPCKVIYQAHYVPHPEDPDEQRKLCQFSWVCEGKQAPHHTNARYRQAEKIAKEVLAENSWQDAIPSNVLFFHNSSVNPGWVYNRAMTIGNHVFYSKGKPKHMVKTNHTE
jgi:spore germination cell wall hydrolase CwlJ-like protein